MDRKSCRSRRDRVSGRLYEPLNGQSAGGHRIPHHRIARPRARSRADRALPRDRGRPRAGGQPRAGQPARAGCQPAAAACTRRRGDAASLGRKPPVGARGGVVVIERIARGRLDRRSAALPTPAFPGAGADMLTLPATPLARALQALFAALAECLQLSRPLTVWLAGGMAVYLYVGRRVTHDVDAEFGARQIHRQPRRYPPADRCAGRSGA